jgi:SPX domain protein involved in polyphosphate accumulation
VDEVARKSLMNKQNIRYERKIYVPLLTRDLVETYIKLHPYGFKNIYFKRQVNSIYFDTTSLNCFWNNELNACKRSKIRVRWYGEALRCPENAQFEIKIKNGNVGDKLTREWKELKDPFILSAIKGTSPVILVSYQRRYFQSYDKKFRITVDSDIKYRGINKNCMERQQYEEVGCVIELKYSSSLDGEAKQIIGKLPGRIGKFSKYARGIKYVYGSP